MIESLHIIINTSDVRPIPTLSFRHPCSARLYKYSKHYTNLLMQTGDDPEIGLILKDICILKVDVSYPFLIEILNSSLL